MNFNSQKRNAGISHRDLERHLHRRAFLSQTGLGVGSLALSMLLCRELRSAEPSADRTGYRGLPGLPHFPPKVKRVIFLCMAGGPSQLETFDYKPKLAELNGQPMPESYTKGQADRATARARTDSARPDVQIRSLRREWPVDQ